MMLGASRLHGGSELGRLLDFIDSAPCHVPRAIDLVTRRREKVVRFGGFSVSMYNAGDLSV